MEPLAKPSITSSATVFLSKAFWSRGERSSKPATSDLAHLNMERILSLNDSSTSSTLASGRDAVCVCGVGGMCVCGVEWAGCVWHKTVNTPETIIRYKIYAFN